MSIIVHAGESMAGRWVAALKEAAPHVETRIYPDLGDPLDADCLLSWRPPEGLLPTLPNLKLLQCSGAGVDQLLGHPDLRPGLPVARLLDPRQADDLAAFAVAVVLNHYRRLGTYEEQQRAAKWERLLPHPSIADLRTGVMGLGTMGGTILARFAAIGARAMGWSRTGRAVAGARTFSQADLPSMLAESDYLVCALPLTGETRGILSAPLFERLPAGSYVVNLGRGAHVVEAELLAALESGHLSGAALDVFDPEPLGQAHPFWSHPKIRVTPHIAAFADPAAAAPQIAENLRRARNGEKPLGLVDLQRGY